MVMADAPPSSTVSAAERGLELLLLGDLRQLLEEPPTRENRRWLMAVLDRLLAGRAHPEMCVPLGVRWIESDVSALPPTLGPELVSQLQRLRDRVAHGATFHTLAHSVRAGLQRAMTQVG